MMVARARLLVQARRRRLVNRVIPLLVAHFQRACFYGNKTDADQRMCPCGQNNWDPQWNDMSTEEYEEHVKVRMSTLTVGMRLSQAMRCASETPGTA